VKDPWQALFLLICTTAGLVLMAYALHLAGFRSAPSDVPTPTFTPIQLPTL